MMMMGDMEQTREKLQIRGGGERVGRLGRLGQTGSRIGRNYSLDDDETWRSRENK